MTNKNKEKNKENWVAKDKTVQEIQFLYGKRRNGLLRKYSPTEEYFERLLKNQPYYYIREKAFYTNGFLCYVDFYIPIFKLAIEIDGPEHSTQKGKNRDKAKEQFLRKERNVRTFRLTNEQCLNLTSIDIHKLAKNVLSRDEYSYRLTEYARTMLLWNKDIGKRVNIDLTLPIYAYSKKHDKIYEFSSCFEMHKSIEMQTKDLIRNLNNPDKFMQSINFIFDNDKQSLIAKIRCFKENSYDGYINFEFTQPKKIKEKNPHMDYNSEIRIKIRQLMLK